MIKKFFAGMFGAKGFTIEVHLVGGSIVTIKNVTNIKTTTNNETGRFTAYSIKRLDGETSYFDFCLADISAFVQVPNK